MYIYSTKLESIRYAHFFANTKRDALEIDPVQVQEPINRHSVRCCYGFTSVILLDSVLLASLIRDTNIVSTSTFIVNLVLDV